MTSTTTTRPAPQTPRISLRRLLDSAGRLQARWRDVSRRGQLGAIDGSARHDRYLTPEDRFTIPRFY